MGYSVKLDLPQSAGDYPLMTWSQWRRRFREHLDLHRLTLPTLASGVNATPGAVSHWLTGRREINLSDFFRLCEAAGADPATILFGEDMAALARAKLSAILEAHPEQNPRYRAYEAAVRPPKAKRPKPAKIPRK